MIIPGISNDKRIYAVGVDAAWVFCMAIPHQEFGGLLPRDPFALKTLVVPGAAYSEKRVEEMIQKWLRAGLCVEEGKNLRFVDFEVANSGAGAYRTRRWRGGAGDVGDKRASPNVTGVTGPAEPQRENRKEEVGQEEKTREKDSLKDSKRVVEETVGKEGVGGNLCAIAGDPLGPLALIFPTVGKHQAWGLTRAKVSEYRESFPGVDVMAECRKARQWCIDNPTRRKTSAGMPRFLSNWLGKEQNRGGSHGYSSGRNRIVGGAAPVPGKYPEGETIGG